MRPPATPSERHGALLSVRDRLKNVAEGDDFKRSALRRELQDILARPMMNSGGFMAERTKERAAELEVELRERLGLSR